MCCAENRPSVVAPPEFNASAGGILPSKIELFWMSPAVELNHYRYAVVDGRTLVVVPYTRRIIAVWSGSSLIAGRRGAMIQGATSPQDHVSGAMVAALPSNPLPSERVRLRTPWAKPAVPPRCARGAAGVDSHCAGRWSNKL